MKNKKPPVWLPLLLAAPMILLTAAALLFLVPQLHDAIRAGVKLAVIP